MERWQFQAPMRWWKKTYLNPVDVILAVGDTVYSSFGKLFVTLIIMGGMMGIVNSTGVLDRALGNLIHRLKDKALAIIPIYVFATALLGLSLIHI